MTGDRERRAKSLFEEALDVEPTLRGAFIAKACGGDEQLERRVTELQRVVKTLAQNGDTDGLDGGMDQPCEVLLRGRELIVSNMDWPVPGCINQKYDPPCTLSIIRRN